MIRDIKNFNTHGCSLNSKCLYSHENPSSVRLCINYFLNVIIPSKQQSLRGRFRNRFGLLNGDKYFKNFIKQSPSVANSAILIDEQYFISDTNS